MAVVLGIKIWNKNREIWSSFSTTNDKVSTEVTRTKYIAIWLAVSLFIVLGGITSIIMVSWQSKLFVDNTNNQNKRILELTEITESLRKNNQVYLMSNVLNQVQDEIKMNPNGPLSDATIARVAALSFSFKPYRFIENDTLSDRELSPERGQLLIALTLMNIDSASFNAIKRKSTFKKADLRGVTLTDIDLSGINLEEADMSFSKITGVNFSYSNLRKIRMSSVFCNQCTIISSDLSRSYFSKSKFKNCNFSTVDFSESDLTYNYLKLCRFNHSNIKFVKFNNSRINEVNFYFSNLERSNMSNCHVSNSDFSNSCIKFVVLKRAILKETILHNTEVHKDWLTDFKSFDVGTEAFSKTQFQVHVDSNTLNRITKYTLIAGN